VRSAARPTLLATYVPPQLNPSTWLAQGLATFQRRRRTELTWETAVKRIWIAVIVVVIILVAGCAGLTSSKSNGGGGGTQPSQPPPQQAALRRPLLCPMLTSPRSDFPSSRLMVSSTRRTAGCGTRMSGRVTGESGRPLPLCRFLTDLEAPALRSAHGFSVASCEG